MADFQLGSGWVESDVGGVDTANSSANTFTSGTSSEGSWSELVTATAFDVNHIIIQIDHDSGGVEEFLLDLGVGGAGVEQPLVTDMPLSGRQDNYHNPLIYSFPLHIPEGTRVAIRGQGTNSNSLKAVARLFGNGFDGRQGCSEAFGIGINSSTFRGQVMEPGGVANTKGAYVELTPSLADDINGFAVAIGNNDNAIINANTNQLVDIAVGGAGSEEIIVSNHWFRTSTAENRAPVPFYDIRIPAGTRIAARMQSTNTDATDRLKTIALVGVR